MTGHLRKCTSGNLTTPIIAVWFVLLFVATGSASTTESDSVRSVSFRELFEWGEYQELISRLEPELKTGLPTADSLQRAELHCYLGVAYFATGRIGDARSEFLSALGMNDKVEPDQAYVTEEMADLFRASRTEFRREQLLSIHQDSLMQQQKKSADENMREIRKAELQRSSKTNMAVALSCHFAAGVLGAVALYEYVSASDFYDTFKDAANEGDWTAYTRYREILSNANTIVLSCGIASGASFSTGLIFTVKSVRLSKGGDPHD